MDEIRKFYTVEEANRLLPQLIATLREMQAAKAEIIAHRDELDHIDALAARNGHASHAQELVAKLDQLVHLLNNRLEALITASLELRDLDEGLLDFPALRHGHMIWLCWKLGEPTVAYWHDLDTGFTSRQRI